MTKLIDADAFKAQLKNDYWNSRNYLSDEDEAKNTLLSWIFDDLDNAKPARPLAIWRCTSDIPDNLICSACGCPWDMWRYESKDLKFCPNCGAEMITDSALRSNVEYLMKNKGVSVERALEIINTLSNSLKLEEGTNE